MSRPTIYVTNAASRKAPHRGPGRVLHIMAAPRAWEQGDGRVPALIPPLPWVREAKAGALPMQEYQARYTLRLSQRQLGPGLLWTTGDGGSDVRDGDTLICACSREAAADGRCHRVWAARALQAAGWRVVLDGEELAEVAHG